MKPWTIFSILALVAPLTWASPQNLTMVNTLAERPVFSFEVGGVTLTRTLAPGNRISLAPGLFSGLGENKLPLVEDRTYYLARFGAVARLFLLGADQVLILNQSGQAVPLWLEGESTVSGVLASNSFALGARGPEGITLIWEDSGNRQQTVLEGGKVYRMLLDSPGSGTLLSVKVWD